MHNKKQKKEFTEIHQIVAKLPRNYLSLYALYSTGEQAFLDYQKLLIQATETSDTDERTQLIIKRYQCRDIAVVFSHLFMEAVIYDYGAINTSDTYMKKYVDKLDFLAKWVVIPKLITGCSFPTNSQAFQLLSKLKKARNELVHFKTRKREDNKSSEGVENIFRDEMEISECFDCMSESLSELCKLDDQKWPLFKWAFIERLISKTYNDVRESAAKDIRRLLGINLQ
ncbi:MAG: hypothetical protein JXA96_17975 [Sedimentisphaerales bacterium]|nr:hypothetical protein [Sedimentisphaerales bacterium]